MTLIRRPAVRRSAPRPIRRRGATGFATTLGVGLCALAFVLVTPSAGRAEAPGTPVPLSSSNFVIVEPDGVATAFGGPVTMAPEASNHLLVFETVGYVFSFINTSKVLVPGQYSSAVDTLMDMVNDPACQAGLTSGSVQVDQATYDDTGAVVSAAVQFEFTCDTGTYVYGSLAYQLPFPSGHLGYYLAGSDGRLLGFGNNSYLSYLGTPTTLALFPDIVGMATTPDSDGYLMAASDGGIFAFGDAEFVGSMGGQHLNAPIVGLAATPDGQGYWEVASDGGIFAFGDAGYHGSMGGQHLSAPIVGLAATPDGQGYWEVASDGGIFAFGDAGFVGSMGGQPLNKPIVGLAATPDGQGYWEVASDGGIFAFGDAGFHGSMGDQPLNAPIVGMLADPSGDGYSLAAIDGGVFSFGDAAFLGSAASALWPLSAVDIAAGASAG
jgi:hypothetical protein